MPEPSLLDRLKQRKIIQWGLAYLAGAWVVVQFLPAFDRPTRRFHPPGCWVFCTHSGLHSFNHDSARSPSFTNGSDCTMSSAEERSGASNTMSPPDRSAKGPPR